MRWVRSNRGSRRSISQFLRTEIVVAARADARRATGRAAAAAAVAGAAGRRSLTHATRAQLIPGRTRPAKRVEPTLIGRIGLATRSIVVERAGIALEDW